MPDALTDQEWREFQAIPDEGYSHRAWVDAKIAARVKDAEDRIAAADALHEGMHACVRGQYWTDDPHYRGNIAMRGLCPTRRALAASSEADHD